MTHPINRQLRPIVMLLHLSQQSYKKNCSSRNNPSLKKTSAFVNLWPILMGHYTWVSEESVAHGFLPTELSPLEQVSFACVFCDSVFDSGFDFDGSMFKSFSYAFSAAYWR